MGSPAAICAPTPFWAGLKTYPFSTHHQLTHISDTTAAFLSHKYQGKAAGSINTQEFLNKSLDINTVSKYKYSNCEMRQYAKWNYFIVV